MKEYIKRKDNIERLSIFIAVCLAVFYFIAIPTVHASGPLQTFAQYMFCDIFGSDKDGNPDPNKGTFKTIKGILSKDGTGFQYATAGIIDNDATTGESTPTDGAYKGIYDAIRMAGWALLFLFVVIQLVKDIDSGRDPLEVGFKAVIQTAIGGIICLNIGKVMGTIAEWGTALIGTVTDFDKSGQGGISMADLFEKDHGNFIWAIGVIMTLLIPWVINLLGRVAAMLAAYSTLIELGLRVIFAPLAVADLANEGLRSPGARYLKKYFAVFLKIIMMLLIWRVGDGVIGALQPDKSSFASIMAFIFESVAIQLTCMGMMFKSGEIANEVVGA